MCPYSCKRYPILQSLKIHRECLRIVQGNLCTCLKAPSSPSIHTKGAFITKSRPIPSYSFQPRAIKILANAQKSCSPSKGELAINRRSEIGNGYARSVPFRISWSELGTHVELTRKVPFRVIFGEPVSVVVNSNLSAFFVSVPA